MPQQSGVKCILFSSPRKSRLQENGWLFLGPEMLSDELVQGQLVSLRPYQMGSWRQETGEFS